MGYATKDERRETGWLRGGKGFSFISQLVTRIRNAFYWVRAQVDSRTRVTGSFSTIPSGTLIASLVGNRLCAPFTMVADFAPKDPARPDDVGYGEYRQYVRGSFTSEGNPVVHSLGPGRNLSPDVWQEDGDFNLGTAYGYRALLGTGSRFVNPDQTTGTQFQGEDEPGIGGASGTLVTMNLEFKGDLIDVGNNNSILATSNWKVTGSATLP